MGLLDSNGDIWQGNTTNCEYCGNVIYRGYRYWSKARGGAIGSIVNIIPGGSLFTGDPKIYCSKKCRNEDN